MAITPDTKDWTWVVERRCAECGFDSSAIDAHNVAALIRDNASQWPAILTGEDVRIRPDPQIWSPLEYSAHVRDVYRLFLTRLELILTQNDPTFPNWDQDETAVTERYNKQDPATVSQEIVAAGKTLADAFDAVPDDSWQRTGRRGDGAGFTVDTFARYLIHDPVHHLWDVTK